MVPPVSEVKKENQKICSLANRRLEKGGIGPDIRSIKNFPFGDEKNKKITRKPVFSEIMFEDYQIKLIFIQIHSSEYKTWKVMSIYNSKILKPRVSAFN